MAITCAERGSSSMRDISPKKSPSPSTERITSRPSSPKHMTPVRFPDFESSEHLARIQCSETRESPRLPARPSPVRLRKQLRDAVHDTRDPRRNLRQVPPVLHREAEAPGHRGARGAVPPEIRDGQDSELMHGGPTPPGARAGGGGRPSPGRP